MNGNRLTDTPTDDSAKGRKKLTKKLSGVGLSKPAVKGNIVCKTDTDCRPQGHQKNTRKARRRSKWVCCPEEVGGKKTLKAYTCQEAQMSCFL